MAGKANSGRQCGHRFPDRVFWCRQVRNPQHIANARLTGVFLVSAQLNRPALPEGLGGDNEKPENHIMGQETMPLNSLKSVIFLSLLATPNISTAEEYICVFDVENCWTEDRSCPQPKIESRLHVDNEGNWVMPTAIPDQVLETVGEQGAARVWHLVPNGERTGYLNVSRGGRAIFDQFSISGDTVKPEFTWFGKCLAE